MSEEVLTTDKVKVISASGASTVRVERNQDVPKVLTISMSGKLPDFLFQGNWTGSDMGTILRHLRRAYYIRTRQMRRDQSAINQVTKEELNDSDA